MAEGMVAEPMATGVAAHELNITKSKGVRLGVETKRQIDVEGKTRKASFFERAFRQSYVDNWKEFKKAGLPVVSMLRITDMHTLVMTDVKADGSEVYGKGFDIAMRNKGNIWYDRSIPRPEIDKIFLKLTTPEKFDDIKRKAEEYIEKANKNGITLPCDDAFEMIIHPDGSWDLITLDLEYAKKNDYPLESIEKDNKNYTELFYRNLRSIRKTMLGEPDDTNKEKPAEKKEETVVERRGLIQKLTDRLKAGIKKMGKSST